MNRRTAPQRRAWTPEDDAKLGTDIDRNIAKRLGRSVRSIESRRRVLGVAPYIPHDREWTADEIAMLGTTSDAALADHLGCSRLTVYRQRERHGIGPFSAGNAPKRSRAKVHRRRERQRKRLA